MNHSSHNTSENYYQILGLDQNADEKQIKSAYRRLALVYHPDKNPGDKTALEKFKQITAAYGLLMDPIKRRDYDRLLLYRDSCYGTSMGFGSLGYTDILNSLFKNSKSRELFEKMARTGSIRMDERFLRETIGGGFLFGGVFYGFWGFFPFLFGSPDQRAHLGDSQIRLSQVFYTLRDRIKKGVVKTVHHVKGFWDSIGTGPSIEDSGIPIVSLEITPREAKEGTTKLVGFSTPHETKKYAVKIPAGTKDGVKLKINEEGSQSFYLEIKILRDENP